MRLPDGTKDVIQIPLTADEALHPEEDYFMTDSRLQDLISAAVSEMLRSHITDPHTVVPRNLLIKWDNPSLRKHAPDVCVIPNVRDSKTNWTTFYVAQEGTRPILIIEVVSASSKEHDRVTKVEQYAQAKVQEYVYIDYWTRKGQMVWEIAGFRLHDNHYLPMLPDEDGAIYCESVGVRMGVDNGRVWMENYETGEPLLTNEEAQSARRAAEAQAEAEAVRADTEAAARQAAEARIAELEAQLKALQAKQGK